MRKGACPESSQWLLWKLPERTASRELRKHVGHWKDRKEGTQLGILKLLTLLKERRKGVAGRRVPVIAKIACF